VFVERKGLGGEGKEREKGGNQKLAVESGQEGAGFKGWRERKIETRLPDRCNHHKGSLKGRVEPLGGEKRSHKKVRAGVHVRK